VPVKSGVNLESFYRSYMINYINIILFTAH
jgi:hypothetical protein